MGKKLTVGIKISVLIQSRYRVPNTTESNSLGDMFVGPQSMSVRQIAYLHQNSSLVSNSTCQT